MTLTDNSTITRSRAVADQAPVVEMPQHPPRPDRTRKVVSWLAIGIALAVLAALVVRLVGIDDGPNNSITPAQITDAKDRPGYRLPTMTRSLTTGDAKDRPGYRLPTTTWSYTTGDAKDQPGYQLPTATP